MSFPSDEQKQAIYGEGNLIVSASAGAGKTAVLAERVLRLIADRDIPIERMLILTFTRAAASEMKTRIGARILEEAERDPARAAYFREQAAAVPNANISTIDSFCSRIVFRHFFRAGLSPACKMLDTVQAAVLQTETRSAALDALAENDPEAYRALVVAFGGDTELDEAVKSFAGFLSTQPDPQDWLDKNEAEIGDPAAFERQLDHQMRRDKEWLQRYIRELQQAADQIPRSCERVLGILDEVLSHARGALVQNTREGYAEALAAAKAVPGKMVFPKGVDASEKKGVQSAKSQLNAFCGEQIERYSVPLDGLSESETRATPVLRAFYALVRTYLSAYRDAKRSRSVLDFSDLEYLAIEILKDDEIAAEYRERFLTIFVDEYQDSNRIQETILSRIARKDALFYVGDVKQSIYRFRKAEPALFLEKCDTFTGSRGTRVDLSENYRSGQAVIDAVNAVFTDAMRKPIAGIDYDTRAALKKGNPNVPDGSVELHLVSTADESAASERIGGVEAQARLAAKIIEERMKRPFVSGKTERACGYGDFAVLLRDRMNFRTWVRTFTEAGIPCYAASAGGYFDAIEVKLVMSLLEVLDNRRQDIPLLAVMRSPMFGFTDEELSALRIERKKTPLLDRLLEKREPVPKIAAFLDTLDRYLALSRRVPLADLVERILDETHYREMVGVLSGGEQRVTNLNELVAMAAECDAAGMSGVHGFLRFMNGIRASGDPGESKAVTANVVRIMTVHGSKGLQFPFVFYGELEGAYNTRSLQAQMIPDTSLGVGIGFFDEYGVPYETVTKQNTRDALKDAMWEEELRVIYVAMTRAEQELYLLGALRNPASTIDKLGQPTMMAIRSANNPLKILMLTLNGRIPWITHPMSEFIYAAEDSERVRIDRPTEAEREALKAQFDWVYPHPTVDTLPEKTSVTGLSKNDMPEFDEPAFETGYDVLSEGSAVHRALECMPLRDEAKRATFLKDLSGVSPFHAEAIRQFADSPLFLRMAKAARVEREWNFLCPMPARRLLPETESDEPILLQGVIDACFVEDGAWVLLDYKTDRVTGDPNEYAKKHAHQVALYAEALHKLSGIPVKERNVVLLGAKAVVRL